MPIHWVNPILCTPNTADWQQVDLDNYVAGLSSNVTGVILEAYANNDGSCYVGYRKHGSTDNFVDEMQVYKSCAFVGVDANHIFEIYQAELSRASFYILGYTTEGFVFFDNAVAKVATIENAWEDVDCSIICPSAVGIIAGFRINIEITVGLRPKGSTMALQRGCENGQKFGIIILKCDANQLIQQYVSNKLNAYTRIYGYVSDLELAQIELLTDWTSYSLAVTDVWTDLTPLPSGANGGFFLVRLASGTLEFYGLRKNGSSRVLDWFNAGLAAYYVEADSSQLVEGFIDTTNMDFYLTGYSLGAGGSESHPRMRIFA